MRSSKSITTALVKDYEILKKPTIIVAAYAAAAPRGV
jgi:hypothetical protein